MACTVCEVTSANSRKIRSLSKSVVADTRIFRMGRYEVLATRATAVLIFTLSVYWIVVLAVDGAEGSFATHPLVRGYCAPPFQIYGLGCREWVVNSVSTTVWNIVFLGIASLTLAISAHWRRSLLGALIATFSTVVLLPSELSIWPMVLVLFYGASSFVRLRRFRQSRVGSTSRR
jgi:hypothetical protein